MENKTLKNALFILLMLGLLAGCSENRMRLPQPSTPPPPPPPPEVDYTDVREHSYRTRTSIPSEENRYEGSLWRDESSWGNLLRDHRARFKRDVLTITGLEDIIIISKPEKKSEAPSAQALKQPGIEGAAAKANQLLDIAQAVTGEDKIEAEQNEVLSALKTISARVVNVLPNGNMVVVAEKIDYRQQNSVRYLTKIQGIIRPEDVSDKNEIEALKLARSEVQIKRQVSSRSLNLGALAPIVGKQSAGLMDRLGHMTTPTSGNRTQTVNTNK
ncbi:MAG: hypothetical protein A2527_08865 [Candidatus Lambdaproteobacteria bacterium RIFOXYD2_FULL_50_16]|uniref:Flagellar biosynthesis protein FlgH n=1 Tax=Candidatus Lambdaproteobacteria bacterium RIFOXYD2_FULL_50_16 TaxID=1817772 RepID=A0A1F6GAY2_9PROT|nr:MAG: hypothetical protein A2527_08865 [Candidatus Lambdaproteobacteria bacterium RIFOXYD2_FULL_50_16]